MDISANYKQFYSSFMAFLAANIIEAIESNILKIENLLQIITFLILSYLIIYCQKWLINTSISRHIYNNKLRYIKFRVIKNIPILNRINGFI